VQDLEDKFSGEALAVAQANLAAAYDQVSQLHTQLQQAQARASAMSTAETQVSQLQAQLQLQRSANEDKATAVAALTAGVQQERDSWQQERLTLLGRAKVTNEWLCTPGNVHTILVCPCIHTSVQTTMQTLQHAVLQTHFHCLPSHLPSDAIIHVVQKLAPCMRSSSQCESMPVLPMLQ